MNLREQAINEMINWLSDEHELGKAPSKIEVADEFDYDDAHYFILKFKKGILGKWLVGVCGFDSDGISCNHTFSEFQTYHKETAKDDCIKIIEYLKEYYKNRMQAELERRGITEEEFANMSDEEWEAKGKEADNKEDKDHMQGFVLLENNNFNFENVINNLKNDWNIVLDKEQREVKDDNLVFNVGENLIAISLMPAPIPDGEAEYFAECNYMWKDAVEVTKRHQAHLMLIIMNHNNDSIECASLFTKVASCCLKEDNALGIYTAGTVFEPKFYNAVAEILKNNELPIPDWIYIGFGQDESGNAAYTYGLESFGKMEIEILNSSHSFEELRNFLFYVCEYVIKNDMIFRDGETVSFSSNELLKITKSKAVRVEGESLKINY